MSHAQAPRFQPDQIIGGCRILRRLQASNVFEVFEAIDDKHDRTFHICLSRVHGMSDPFVAKRFENEGQALCRLNHPHVRRVRTLGEHEGFAMIIADPDEGTPLDESPAEPALSLSGVHAMFTQMVSGLRALHAKNILHRDLRPANVIVRPGGLVRLSRVGLLIGDVAEHLVAQEQMARGQFNYIAPEVLNGKPSTVASDIYGLGLLFHYLLTRSVPFAADELEQTKEKIATTNPALSPRLSARLPAEWTMLLEKLTAKNPASRPQSVEAVAAEIATWDATKFSNAPEALNVAPEAMVDVASPNALGATPAPPTLAPLPPAMAPAPPKAKSGSFTITDLFHVIALTAALVYLSLFLLKQRSLNVKNVAQPATSAEPMLEPPHATPPAAPIENATDVLKEEMGH